MQRKLHSLLHIDEPAAGLVSPSKRPRPLRNVLMADIAKLLLLSYVLLIFNSLIPIAADVLAHTFWEKEHLLTVHQVNGKYHVHFELLNSEKQTDGNNRAPGTLKFGTDDYVHLVFSTGFHFVNSGLLTSTSYQPYIYLSGPSLLMDIDYPPPRA